MIDERKLLEDFENMALSWGERHEKESKYRRFDMEEIERVVENQPKIGGWILTSERLPEEVGKYIIHVITGTGEDYVGMWLYERGAHLSGRQTYIDDKQGYWASPYNGDPINEPLSKRVIAWQPFPKPYSES